MQNRPISELYTLKQRFTGTGKIGNRLVWYSSGNYLDFRGGRNLRHRHSYFEACLVLEGKGSFTPGDEKYSLSRGDLFIADPGVIHEIISHKKESLVIQFLSFSFNAGNEGGEDREKSPRDRCIDLFLEHHTHVVSGCDELEVLFRSLQLASLEPGPLKRTLRNDSLVTALILDIILFTIREIPDPGGNSTLDTRVQAALGYMRDNSFRKLSVEEVADHAAASSRTLRRLIREYCGMTVIQKCFDIRIRESARSLLANPEKSVSEVSYAFGFENPSDFCRGFKKVLNQSPGRFRENRGTLFV